MAAPTEGQAVRYVETISGIDTVLDKARGYTESGDIRFAAELLEHAVFAEPDNSTAKKLSPTSTHSSAWARRNRPGGTITSPAPTSYASALPSPDRPRRRNGVSPTIEQLLDTMCIRLDGLRAAAEAFVIDWNFTDPSTTVRLTLANGALTHVENPKSNATADLSLTLTKAQLLGLLAGRGLAGIDHRGDPDTLDRLLGLLDNADPGFAIITP